jgi:hypothetical protein
MYEVQKLSNSECLDKLYECLCCFQVLSCLYVLTFRKYISHNPNTLNEPTAYVV